MQSNVGHLEYLFNITRPASHADNTTGVPIGFAPICLNTATDVVVHSDSRRQYVIGRGLSTIAQQCDTRMSVLF